jgi:hypothetical protein
MVRPPTSFPFFFCYNIICESFRLLHFGGELDSTGQVEVQVAGRGWSAGHVKSRLHF